MACPTCGAETREAQRFCMECGNQLDPGAVAATAQLPAVDPASSVDVTATAVLPAFGPTAGPAPVRQQVDPVPITIIEQTSPIPVAVSPTGTGAPPVPTGGVTWRPLAVDPWPTPRSQPTVVGAPLRPGPVTILAVGAGALGLIGCATTVGSYRFADGTRARFAMDDLRSNSFVVMLAVAIVAVIGVAVLLVGRRVGAGLAAGAATALASIATMDVSLVVAQLHEARRVGLVTGSVTITWEPGFYALVAAGTLALGALAFGFGAWREGGASVNPAIAVLGTLGVATMIVGALIPTGARTWADNLSVPTFGTLPSWLRLGALAVVGVVGVVAFVSRKRWATALAVGATTALAAQWAGVLNPPQPNTRGGPGIAITPLEGTALAVHAGGLVAVVLLAVAGLALAELRD